MSLFPPPPRACFAWENSNLILLLSFPLFASFTASPSTEWWSTPAIAHCCVCSQERVTLTGNLKTSFIVPGHSWVYMAVEIFNVVRTVRAARPYSHIFCCFWFRISAALTSRCWIHLVMPYKFDKDSSSSHTFFIEPLEQSPYRRSLSIVNGLRWES